MGFHVMYLTTKNISFSLIIYFDNERDRVKTLTIERDNVKTLTIERDNVKTLTIERDNVKTYPREQ
jgi:hypothetical protein